VQTGGLHHYLRIKPDWSAPANDKRAGSRVYDFAAGQATIGKFFAASGSDLFSP